MSRFLFAKKLLVLQFFRILLVIALLVTMTACEKSSGGQPIAKTSSQVPSFAFMTTDGVPHKIEDFRGKVVLIVLYSES